MIRDVLRHFPWLDLVVVGQIIFLALFLGALAWVFRPGSVGFYRRLALLPMEQEEKQNDHQ